MAEPVEYVVGFVYSVVYRTAEERVLVVEGELLSFDEENIQIKGPKGPVVIGMTWITNISRK